MRSLFLLVCTFLICYHTTAQKIEPGLWNTGRSFSITPTVQDSISLQKQLSLVQIYPGFSVVKSIYEVINTKIDTAKVNFEWADTLTTNHSFLSRLNNLPSANQVVLVNQDTVPISLAKGAITFSFILPPGKLTTITTFQLTPNNQAKLSGDETIKEENAFVFSFSPWPNPGIRQVFVRLMGGLSLTNMVGIYPPSVLGTMQQLKWVADSSNTMIIWYEGQAPDYKFEKKVLPQAHLFFQDINDFDISQFGSQEFRPVSKNDFTTNTRSLLGTVLYFALFSIPWIILVFIILFLLKKPKTKTN